MELSEQIKQTNPKAVLNDNSAFQDWINENLTLDDVLKRCPNIISDIFEEYNNDWFEVVELAANELGIQINSSGEIIGVEADEEEDDPALTAWNAGYDDGYSGKNLGSPDPEYTDDYESGRAEGKHDRQGVK